jgi:hypothetical protein
MLMVVRAGNTLYWDLRSTTLVLKLMGNDYAYDDITTVGERGNITAWY